MKMKTSIHVTPHPSLLGRVGGLLLILLLALSCSESDDEEANEYANWQARNDVFFLSLEDSLRMAPASSLASEAFAWKKIKSFTKDENTEGAVTDYIYVKQLEQGYGGVSPLYTDSVRVSYRGRLIPSATYPTGYIFDQTYTGDYSLSTTGVTGNVVSGYVNGFATAIMHMHEGDRWRVYIPYQLGYGATEKNNIPAYSVMIFDVVLIDYASVGESLTPWSSRQL